MPPRRQPEQEIELNELRYQLQQLQETVNAQQARLDAQRKQRYREFDNSPSSSTYNRHTNRVKIPDFEGRTQPEEFKDWLQTVERIFECKKVPEDQKVKIVTAKLKKYASIWWENLKQKRKHEGKRKIRTWEKMRRKLTRKFLPEQKGFIRSSFAFIPVYSCNPEFQVATRPHHIVETDTERESNEIPEEEYEFISTKSVYDSDIIPDDRNVISAESVYDSDVTLTKPVYDSDVTLTEPVYDSDVISKEPEYEEPQYDDEVTVPEPVYDSDVTLTDREETLVTRQSLYAASAIDESWSNHNNFHTPCITEDKVCDVIMDDKSCDNIVTDDTEEKFEIPTYDHPFTYWFDNGSEVKVPECFLFTFSIGERHQDQVWFNVVPMKDCDFPLKMPWKFDQCVLYNGHMNTYQFGQDGEK